MFYSNIELVFPYLPSMIFYYNISYNLYFFVQVLEKSTMNSAHLFTFPLLMFVIVMSELIFLNSLIAPNMHGFRSPLSSLFLIE